MRDADLDRILADWLADGAEVAPRRYVDAALTDVATTPQRPAWRARGSDRSMSTLPFRTRLLIAAALLAILALGIAIGIGAGLLREPAPLPPQVVIQPPPAIVTPALTPVSIDDWAVRVSLPEGWEPIEGLFDYRHFRGTSPEGDLSIGHESPYFSAVCDPDCSEFEVPQTIPYDADKQRDALMSAVAEIAGSSDWRELPDGVLPQVDGGVRLETTGAGPDGRDWRRVYIVGINARNLVTFAFSQPTDIFDPALLDAILAEVELLPAPVYSDGDLIPWEEGGTFALQVPGSWWYSEQPNLDGLPMGGVRRFGDGEVVVSVGRADGTLGWCDPDCRVVAGLTSLDALAAAFSEGPGFGPATETTLGGEPALMFDSTGAPARRIVVATRAGRPAAIGIDTKAWEVQPSILDEIVASFTFVDTVIVPVAQELVAADGRVMLGLSAAWEAPISEGGPFRLGADQAMTVRIGSEDGTIVTCGAPFAAWDRCREITVSTLDDLARAVLPASIDDDGVPPFEPVLEYATLGGEPSIVLRMAGHESPSEGAHELAYVVAFHDGRPVIVRMTTSADALEELDSVVAGFRFVD